MLFFECILSEYKCQQISFSRDNVGRNISECICLNVSCQNISIYNLLSTLISLLEYFFCLHQLIQHQTLLYPINYHRYSCWKFITVQYFLSTFGVISTEIYYNTNHYDKLFSISSEAMLYRNILKRIMLKRIMLNKNISRYYYR